MMAISGITPPNRTCRLGELALRAGQPDQAEVHLFGGLATARMVDYRWGEASILLVIAEVHARRGEFDRALATLMEGVQISSTYQFTHILERQHLAIAEYAERMGGYSAALAALKEGFALPGEPRRPPPRGSSGSWRTRPVCGRAPGVCWSSCPIIRPSTPAASMRRLLKSAVRPA